MSDNSKKTNRFTFIRIIALACALVSLITVLPLSAFAAEAEECDHEFILFRTEYGMNCREGTIEHLKCEKCGFEKEDVIPGTPCKYGEILQSKEATCTEMGYTVRQCSVCHDYLEKYYDELGHDWQLIVIEPTCETDGYKKYICLRCGCEEGYTVLPAIGHDWQFEGMNNKEATCFEEGCNDYYCPNCHGMKYEPVPKKAHTVSADWRIVEKATCSAPGVKYRYCTVCGELVENSREEIPARNVCTKFSKTRIVKAATVSAEGISEKTCLECGKVYREKIARKTPGTTVLSAVKNTANGVNISWKSVSGADNYIVYRKAQGEKSWSRLSFVKGSTLNFTDKSVQSGKSYTYTVKAQNTSGYGGFDKKGLSIRFIETPVLKAANKNGSVRLTWEAASGAKGYYVYRKAGSETKWTKIATVKSGSALSYSDKNVKSGTKYAYTVKAYNGSAASSFISVANVYLAQPKVALSNGKSKISVKWSKISGAKGYYIYRKAGSETKWTKIASLADGSALSYTDKNVKTGVKYTYTVKAYNGSYVGSFCSGVSLKKTA